jgi:hypothetical protein
LKGHQLILAIGKTKAPKSPVLGITNFDTLPRIKNKKKSTTQAIMADDFELGLLDDDDYKKSVLRTKILGIAECFMVSVYGMP